jgi:hypothetical protein
MNAKALVRSAAIAVAMLGASFVQGCAVTTGRWVPDRAVAGNHNMVSHYDVLHQQSAGGSTLHMPRPQRSYSPYLLYW